MSGREPAQANRGVLAAALVALRDAWTSLTDVAQGRRYQRRIMQRLARGDVLGTIGVEIADEAETRERGVQWLARLVELGLRPEHLCVEYGCGSLWCAEPVIRHLQPNRFVGLDLTDQFYTFGRQRLGDLLQEKQVRLATISRRTLRDVAAMKPDFVYSHRVIHHVSPKGLKRYVGNLIGLLHGGTVLVIENDRKVRADGTVRGRRPYDTPDIAPYLPSGWQCRREQFGFVITHRAASPN
jgi:hypothetical protein